MKGPRIVPLSTRLNHTDPVPRPLVSSSHICRSSPGQASHPPPSCPVLPFRFLYPTLFLLAVSVASLLVHPEMLTVHSRVLQSALREAQCYYRTSFAAASQAPSVDRYRRSFKAIPSLWSSHPPVFRSTNPHQFATLRHAFNFAPFWPVLGDSGPRPDSSQRRRQHRRELDR